MNKFILFTLLVCVGFITPQVNSKLSFGEALDKAFKTVATIAHLVKRFEHKTYEDFIQEVEHARVVVTEDSYRVEKVTPCQHGHHDIVKADQPVEIHLRDDVVVIQDRYCRKCGQHFFSEPRDEL